MSIFYKALAVLYFSFSILHGNYSFETIETEEIIKQHAVVISLGSNCFPAQHTNHHNLRTMAFPFDWNVTPFESLVSLIKTDFEGYCELEHLYMIDRNMSDAVVNTKHSFIIHHYFEPIDWDNGLNGLIPLNQEALEHFEEIKSMFQRRIERFIKVMNSDQLIYFIRFEETNYDQANQLYNLLKEKYHLSNFFLICLDEYYLPRINTWESSNERIFHFYLNPTRPIAHGSLDCPHESFTRVFSELGLLKNQDQEL